MKTTHIQDLAIIDVKWLKEEIDRLEHSMEDEDKSSLESFAYLEGLKTVQTHLYSLEQAMSDAIDEFSGRLKLPKIEVIEYQKCKQNVT